MELQTKEPIIEINSNKNSSTASKREHEENTFNVDENANKKRKLDLVPETAENIQSTAKQQKLKSEIYEKKDVINEETSKKLETPATENQEKSTAKPHIKIKALVQQPPKKRLQIPPFTKNQQKNKYIYGNYTNYYGYRNKTEKKEFHDVRLDVFKSIKEIFKDKEVLDIGCNLGLITMEFAKNFLVKYIVGLDIDRGLIKLANKRLVEYKKTLPIDNQKQHLGEFPYNIKFICANYVLKDDILLEIEREKFDIILCLSITKWIHLNFGDNGLKQAFKRMYIQLRKGGKLILEAQPFDNYKRRKKLTETIFENYKSINLFPKQFTEYLLSEDVGFKTVELIGIPEHCEAGFKRPLQIFCKE